MLQWCLLFIVYLAVNSVLKKKFGIEKNKTFTLASILQHWRDAAAVLRRLQAKELSDHLTTDHSVLVFPGAESGDCQSVSGCPT